MALRICSLALAIAALGAGTLTAQTTDSTSHWATQVKGTWSCAGAFANGKALGADIVFAPALGGRWLSYHHQDKAPGRYEASALLGPAVGDSALSATMIFDNFGGHRRFLSTASSAGEITLLRDSTDTGARAERFTFRPRTDGSLWFGWEIGRSGQWFLGDSLSCHKS